MVLTDPDDAGALESVRRFAEERLAPHQRPARYLVTDDLPRGVMGKVLKHRLAARLSAGPAATTTTTTTTTAATDPESRALFLRLMTEPLDDPSPVYRELRERAGALLTEDGTLVLSRYRDVDAALRHRALGKSDEWLRLQLGVVSEDVLRPVMELMQRSMILSNPPDHTRLRRLVSSAFTGRHVEGLRAVVTRRTDELLAALAAEPGADFKERVAVPLPIDTIAELLGIPAGDRAGLIPVIHDLGLLMEPAADAAALTRGAQAQVDLAAYFTGLLARKRAEPADDLLSRMAGSHEEGALDETEMIATALLLFGAGNTPTANLLGNGLCALLDHPEQLDRLRARPELIPDAVEEMLRFDSPAQFDAHSVLEPVTLAGVELAPGDRVMTLLGAANHDPERFADPDTFDIERGGAGHLSFAAGIHFCLGAHLSRLQTEVFFGRLLSGYREITLTEPPERHPGLGNRGYRRIPLALAP